MEQSDFKWAFSKNAINTVVGGIAKEGHLKIENTINVISRALRRGRGVVKFWLNYFKFIILNNKGESGIRTHGIRKDSSDFKSDAIDQLCHLAKRLALRLILI